MAFAGYNAAFLGRADETLAGRRAAMRLDPADRRHSVWFFFGGFAELLLGRTEEAIAAAQQILGTQSQLWKRPAVPDGRRTR